MLVLGALIAVSTTIASMGGGFHWGPGSILDLLFNGFHW